VLAALLLTLGLLVGPAALPAYAEGRASTFTVDANLDRSGVLRVEQTVTFSGTVPAELSQRFQTREDLVGDRQYVASLAEVRATAGGAPLSVRTETDDRFTTVTVPTNGADQVVVSYTVTGAVVNTADGTALRWRLLQGLSVEVAEFSATVQIPGLFTYVRCIAGPPNATGPCTFAASGTEDVPIPTFRDGPRGEREVVGIDIGFAPDVVAANEVVERRWTLGRAFSSGPLPLGLALGLLALGGFGLLAWHRRTGSDARAGGAISKAAEFVPIGPGQSEFRVVSDIRPGHVGTVADERVDPIDVTATLLDLAVRGHLLITELPRTSDYAATDWQLTRRTGADELRPFEASLLNGIAAEGEQVRVSGIARRVQESIGSAQDALYEEMVAHGWFERRPDAVRNRWTQLGLVALVVAVAVLGVLVAFTTFGLVGLALVALALGLVFVAQEVPARTAKGAALLSGLGALRSDLLSHPTDQMPPGAELREISEILPYAVVLGGVDRWLDAIVATDDDRAPDPEDLAWYRGPDSWHLQDLPRSLRNFITTVSGTLFSR
jgi:hypothetical protein